MTLPIEPSPIPLLGQGEFRSLLDPNVIITGRKWSMTLTKSVNGKTHAKIFFERSRSGNYQLVEAHFTSDATSEDPNCKTPKIFKKKNCDGFSYFFCNLGEVKIRRYDALDKAKDSLRYEYRSETHLIDREVCEDIIEKIYEEKDEQDITPHGYRAMGQHSWFVKKEKIYRIDDKDIKQLYKEYPQRFFLEMARFDKDEKFLKLYENRTTLLSVIVLGPILPLAFIPILGSLPVTEAITCIENFRNGEPYEHFPCTKEILGLKRNAIPEWYQKAVEKMKTDYRQYVKLIEAKSHNCETWAEEKFGMADIKLPHDWKDKVFSTVDKHATIPNPDPERAKPKPKKESGSC